MATLETLVLLSVLTKGYWCSELTADGVQSQLQSESSLCQLPQLKTSQRSWKDGNQNIDVFLTRDNFACQVGDPCTSPSPQDGIVVSILQVDLQLGDWLTLWFNEEGDTNLTNLYLTINPMSLQEMYSCDANQQPESPPFIARNAENKDNVTLGTELLTTGVHLFSVRLSTPSAVCGLSWRINVTVKPQECTKFPSSLPCFGYGSCITEPEKATFTCNCCPGYIGRYCEEENGCYGNPCQHGGFCVDIVEGLAGSTYQCLCPHGYRGQSCEIQLNICDKKPCQNNAACWGNETTYYCDCPPGFTGGDCETNINECQSNPCLHGVCEDEVAKYKCYCLPGFGGDHCEFEYDECDSSPCINGGACEDLVAGYRCHCGPGYKGRRCQVKVDLCYPNPCTTPAQCVDRGNNYSCICHPGYNGPGCTQRYDSCYPNPCQNGGTCQPKIDWFLCSCVSGFTGDICNVHSPHSLPRTLEDTSRHHPGNSFIDSANEALDHLHNIYIAVASLAGACLIVLAMAIACHCRAHKTYQRFTKKRNRSCSEIKKQKFEDPDKLLLNLNGGASERNYQDPRYEATSIDLVDNVSTPLID